MKYEPLKEKIRFLRIEGTSENVILGSPFMYLHDVKSAVQGLLEDLERAKRVTCDENKKAHLDYCVYLVKKWFPDAVEEADADE